jgi:hypothetical protein
MALCLLVFAPLLEGLEYLVPLLNVILEGGCKRHKAATYYFNEDKTRFTMQTL